LPVGAHSSQIFHGGWGEGEGTVQSETNVAPTASPDVTDPWVALSNIGLSSVNVWPEHIDRCYSYLSLSLSI